MSATARKKNLVVVKQRPEFHLEPVLPAANELAKRWEFVKLGIEEILRRSHIEGLPCSRKNNWQCANPEHLYFRFRPEDVYLAIMTGRASLYMTWLRGTLTGFGVVQRVADINVNQAPFLLAWLGFTHDKETVPLYFAELEKLAVSLKLSEIRLVSTRKAWLRRKPSEDWQVLTSHGWVKDVNPLYMRMAPEIVLRKVL